MNGSLEGSDLGSYFIVCMSTGCHICAIRLIYMGKRATSTGSVPFSAGPQHHNDGLLALLQHQPEIGLLMADGGTSGGKLEEVGRKGG